MKRKPKDWVPSLPPSKERGLGLGSWSSTPGWKDRVKTASKKRALSRATMKLMDQILGRRD